jgi:hypothetical protein
MLTIDDLWQEYREKCCPGESGEELHWQKMAFFAGITATIGNIIDQPSCFEELKDSLIQWVENQEAEKN